MGYGDKGKDRHREFRQGSKATAAASGFSRNRCLWTSPSASILANCHS
jgi:hypothetical protein